MVSSVAEVARSVSTYPELEGARILVTGVTPCLGGALVRTLAAHRARLVVHCAAPLADRPGPDAGITYMAGRLTSDGAATRLAQAAVRALGGLQAVVNIVSPDPRGLTARADAAAFEHRAARALGPALAVGSVAANRMRLTWTEGVILNVLADPGRTAAAAALGQLTRAGLAAMTRGEARRWADEGIAINAVAPAAEPSPAGPRAPELVDGEADLASLALYLASGRGGTLSGLVLDAAGLSTRRCLPPIRRRALTVH
jgi:NAD(P)-dependent dehydrogenase (short-subunit alcohol dehydrogenase family)